MDITKHYDKVSLNHLEVQEVLKAHIEKETGRKVRGDVFVESRVQSSPRGLNEEFETHKMVVTGSHAHTFLESAVPPAQVVLGS